MRHYEREGLIVPGRFGNGYRDYCRSTIDRVLTIRELLEFGLPVRLIKEVLARQAESGKVASAGPTPAELLAEVQRYRHRLAARIDRLCAQRAALDAYLDERAALDA